MEDNSYNLPQSWLCILRIHKWSKWIQYDKNKDKNSSWADIKQKKQCLKCHIVIEKHIN